MSDESSATSTEAEPITRARPQAIQAVRDLMALARADFDSAPMYDVMAGWSTDDVLVVVACAAQAHRIAAFLRSNGIADPEHLPEVTPSP